MLLAEYNTQPEKELEGTMGYHEKKKRERGQFNIASNRVEITNNLVVHISSNSDHTDISVIRKFLNNKRKKLE